MGQQTLKTIIALSGRVDNSFGAIGEALLNVGSHIDALSQKIIDFGKESVEEYVQYDDVMREVQALGEYDAKTMQTLHEYNKTIAQTSKYTMDQAAQAEVMMAQLGLDIEQTKTLMPTVMNLATAANIDLADSLDYLYYTLNALGEPMDYANVLSDQMSKTAALSAADIDTLGQSLQRLGSGAQYFTGGSAELLAILGGLSQFGEDMQGSNVGTQLRNFMLTLLAPTQSKQKIMDSLGVTEEAWAEFESDMDDAGITITDTAEAMNELGLTVFDSKGNIKPAIQIIGELGAALDSLNDPAREKEILGNMFGKRTTITAENLLAAYDTIIAYQDEILNGSAGYTESMSDTMEGGLGGALREFTAAWDAFETTIGEEIAPVVESTADGLTDIVNSLTNMDEDAMDALVSGATALAATGPALLLAGGAFRLIGFAMTPVGAATLTLTGFITAYNAVKELAEGDMADNFGDMDIDSSAMSEYVNALSEDFKASYAEINSFKDALDGAVESYKTASTTFASDILTAMLTGATLSETDKASLMSLGTDMHAALLEGITNSTAATMSYWEMLFGGAEEAPYDPDYQEIIELTNTSYQNALAQAQSISQGFRDALTSAFDDGTISDAEYQELQKWMQEYNAAMARAAQEAQDRENAINLEKLLHKAQTASFDSILETAAMIEEGRNSVLAQEEDTFLTEYYGLELDGADQDTLDAAKAKYQERIAAVNAPYNDALWRLWESSMGQSDLSEAYAVLGEYADKYLAGEITGETASDIIGDLYGRSKYAGDTVAVWENPVRQQLGEYMARMVASMGGYESIQKQMDAYVEMGNTDGAHRLARLLTMEGLATDFAWMNVTSNTPFGWWDGEVVGMEGMRGSNAFNSGLDYDTLDKQVSGFIADYSVEAAKRTVDAFSGGKHDLGAFFTSLGESLAHEDGLLVDQSIKGANARELNNIIEGLRGVYDFEKVLAQESAWVRDNGLSDYYAAYSLMYGNASANPENYLITATVEPVVPPGAVEAAAGEQVIPATVEPDATIDAAGMEAEAAAAGAAAETSLMAGYGDPTLDATVDSTGISSDATTAGSSAVAALYAAWGSPTLTARVSYSGIRSGSSLIGGSKFSLFAEGGRATEASIFGEAGPEWAIPEEHTDRVASLFNAAREAAGFTWPELIARNGGLNAGGGTPAQIIYSPTIYANDANGVEQKLIEDKERLDRWWSEKQMHDDVEVYA